MHILFVLLLLLAAVFFGLAAARVVQRVDFLALGLLAWVLVPLINSLQRL